jgi:hypothetical protein
MNVRTAGALALIAAVSVGAVPAHAATKPKPIKGGYSLSLTPDPTQDVDGQLPDADPKGCAKRIPNSWDRHEFTVPAAGTLQVVLDSPDPTGTPNLGPLGDTGTDWDLWILAPDGTGVDASHGATSHEMTTTKFKKKQKVVFEVCNLVGENKATVAYTFTYK